jgi:outer membrane protein assembly factor BamA
VKHGIVGVTSYNNYTTDSSNLPINGFQMHGSTELALPPGDVGFMKGQAALAGHLSITNRLALHTSLSSGYIHSISFGGLCGPALTSDKFLLGGTGSFRGFIPAGIGPRCSFVGRTNGGLGDALGGNIFYTATMMASVAPQDTNEGISQITRNVRLFAFASAGSCISVQGINTTNLKGIFSTSRMSAGFGVSSGVLGPARIEATYAVPLRCFGNDGKRRFQLGISLSII